MHDRGFDKADVAHPQCTPLVMPGHILEALVAPFSQHRAPAREFACRVDGGAACGHLQRSLTDRPLQVQALTQPAQVDPWPERVMAIGKAR
ncbi:hypothetical protein D3C71_1972210 [compost metagenome]